ncbi:MAG: 16S rRNA (guanine(966)-N(2))-methyltransferase RsmD [Succinivibrio sp.]|jgi:16S rRNA (guanine966-N2)-methyltransferase|nr:16S rRNA (guanine(966)-N(2))-methyltransferase RsmD [Succinivibrio sp.]
MQTGAENHVRIIGGSLRGRTLPVLDLPGLRPTPDRVRETVFSWLDGSFAGARVLDLFAGSGALGIEALSRGAADVVLVEKDPKNAQNLESVIQSMKLSRIMAVNQDALSFLKEVSGSFDIVFADPPYQSGTLLSDCLKLLLKRNLVTNLSQLYVEISSGSALSVPGYEVLREDTAGQVRFALWTRSSLLF